MFGFSSFAEVPFADIPATSPSGINYSLTCAVGSYAVTGKAATFLLSHRLTGAVGNYSVTGKAVTFSLAKKLTASVGSYAVTGQNATLTYFHGNVNYSLTCSAGSYAVLGKTATFSLTTNYVLPCLNGSYALTGTDSYIQYYKGIWALESDTSLYAWSVEASTPNVWTTETATLITWN